MLATYCLGASSAGRAPGALYRQTYGTVSPLTPRPLIYAHRGDRTRAADNTIEAFDLAVEAGADGIELDVRRTIDGVLVVSHDPVDR